MGSIVSGIFCFILRAGEFTTSNEVSRERALTQQDISVDLHEYPKHLMVHLRSSKTDQFGAGFTLHLGGTGNELCPV